MAAVIVDVADAITTDLNIDPATNFGLAFVAERSDGEFDRLLKDIDLLHVDVVPAGHPSFLLSNIGGAIDHQAAVQVILRKRLVVGTNERFLRSDVNALRLALQKIAVFFVRRELTTLTTATWISTEIEVDCNRSDARENHQYTGIVRIVYEVIA